MKRKLKLLASVSALQMMVQGVSALGGLLLVRVLEKRELAAYTIAVSLQMILNLLTDLGIGSGLNAIGGRVWKDRSALSRLVATAFAFRKQLALAAVPVGIVISILMLRQIEVPWLKVAALTAIGIGSIWAMWTISIYAVPLRLHGKYLAVQGAELAAAAVRVLSFGVLAFVFLDATTALLVVVASSVLQALVLRKLSREFVDDSPAADDGQRAEISTLVKRQYFPVIFYAFRGQIAIWLIALFGTVENVAEVGALSRLGVLFAMTGSVVNSLVLPTFARCDSLPRLMRLFAAAIVAYVAFGSLLFAAGLFIPGQLLWLIGPKYSGLTEELPWLLGGSIVGGFAGLLYALASARAWIWQAWISPVVTIALQVVLLWTLDLRDVKGVLAFGFYSTLPGLLANGYLVARGLLGSHASGRIIRATSPQPMAS